MEFDLDERIKIFLRNPDANMDIKKPNRLHRSNTVPKWAKGGEGDLVCDDPTYRR